MGVFRSFLLRLFLQCRYRNFADNSLGGADHATSSIVALSGNPLDTADTETHGSGDCASRCAHQPRGKSPQISAWRSRGSCQTTTNDGNYTVTDKGRTNFSFSFGFGTESVDWSTFGIQSVSAKSHFWLIFGSGGCHAEFRQTLKVGHHQIRPGPHLTQSLSMFQLSNYSSMLTSAKFQVQQLGGCRLQL